MRYNATCNENSRLQVELAETKKEHNEIVKIREELEQRVDEVQDELHVANEKWHAVDVKYRELKDKYGHCSMPGSPSSSSQQQARLGESLKEYYKARYEAGEYRRQLAELEQLLEAQDAKHRSECE